MTLPVLPDPLWTYEDVAAYLKCSPRHVHHLLRHNGLPSLRVGRYRRFMPTEVELWAASQQRGQR